MNEINLHKNKIIKKEEEEDSLIINDDLFEQPDQEDTDEDQIIQNEEKDEECSYASANSKNGENRQNLIIDNSINEKEELNNIQKNNTENNINNSDKKIINYISSEELRKINNDLNNISNNKENINNLDKIKSKDNIQTNSSKEKVRKRPLYKKNKIIKNELITNLCQNVKNKEKKENKIKNKKDNLLFKRKKEMKLPLAGPHSLLKFESENNNSINNRLNKTEQSKSKSKKKENNNIHNIRNKKNIKIIQNKKINKSLSRNEENKSPYKTDKNKNIKTNDISYDKYGNKSLSKTNEGKCKIINCIKNNKNINSTTKSNIKLGKKVNRSYNNNSSRIIHHTKNQSNYSYNSNQFKKIKKINLKNIKLTQESQSNINANKSSILTGHSASLILQERKQFEHDTGVLKKILINKINNQINEVIKGKEQVFFNENNKLFFLGFCDILFELGFLHIKETGINDIAKIKKQIKNLITQPYTNRDLLSEKFLFNEQQLLICAWKTILNNFVLVTEFKNLPKENEEISIEDCKLFIFIVTGLFIGYNNKFGYETNLNSDRKAMVKNNSTNNFNVSPSLKKSKEFLKNIYSNKLNQSYNKSSKNSSEKKTKYHFRKKSENSNSKFNNSMNNNNENILKKILENRKKSDYNYKSILKIKNFFNYFSELRKLYNIYQKDLKNINRKIEIEKDFTFHPKTNKNNKILLGKFAPSMNFFERNALIKNRNDKKKIILQRERSKKMLKECTFEPLHSKNKSNKKEPKNPKEISNRLYYNNYSNRKQKTEINSNSHSKENSNHKIYDEKLNNSEFNSNKNRVYSKALIRANKNKHNENNYNHKIDILKKNLLDRHLDINSSCSKSHKFYKKNGGEGDKEGEVKEKPKENFHFFPNINKKLDRGMFAHSPLKDDLLLNKRIQNLRETNLKKFIDNYEKNNREVLSNEIKKNQYLLKELIMAENKNMRMEIEKRTNKDTFENFQNFDVFNYDNYYYNNPQNEPLFTVEIKIKQNIKTIEVYQDDEPEKLAYDFCIENMLGKGSYEKIVTIIKSKLQEINNGMFNEDVNYFNEKNGQNNIDFQNENQINENNNVDTNENKDIVNNINNEDNVVNEKNINNYEINYINDKKNNYEENNTNIEENKNNNDYLEKNDLINNYDENNNNQNIKDDDRLENIINQKNDKNNNIEENNTNNNENIEKNIDNNFEENKNNEKTKNDENDENINNEINDISNDKENNNQNNIMSEEYKNENACSENINQNNNEDINNEVKFQQNFVNDNIPNSHLINNNVIEEEEDYRFEKTNEENETNKVWNKNDKENNNEKNYEDKEIEIKNSYINKNENLDSIN